MELDKHILNGMKPLTVFDEIESKFISSKCYFSNTPSDFADLTKCRAGTLLEKDNGLGAFLACVNNANYSFHYCLPFEWIDMAESSENIEELRQTVENLKKEVGSLKSALRELKSAVNANSNRIHTMAQLQYGTPNPQSNCELKFIQNVLGVS